MKRILSLFLSLCILISFASAAVVPADAASATVIKTTPTGYTSAGDVDYSYYGTTIANWGARGENCTFLSSFAQDYYTGAYSFNALQSHSGGTSQSNAPQSDLYKTLQIFMRSTSTHQTSYNETKDLYKFTDCLRSDTSHISSFYSGRELNGQWDSGSTWNREHTWPNSKGLNGSDENDIMMLRPTWVQENSSRGNTAYGESSNFYDPGISTHGDCARIVLYVYVRWGNTGNMWGSSGVMENLDVLLKWMAEDPVDTWEMGRNDAVQSITGVRNVFVDYPELAWLLFGRQVPASVTTPSMGTGSADPSNPTDPQPTDPKPTEPETTDPQPTDPSVPSGRPISSLDELKSGAYAIVLPNNYAMGVFETNDKGANWITAVQPTIENGVVTDAKGGIWNIRVTSNGTVILTDSNGKAIAPLGGTKNGITSDEYEWKVACKDGKFTFAGQGSDNVLIASNTSVDNKFRAYKTTTATTSPNAFPYEFLLYPIGQHPAIVKSASLALEGRIGVNIKLEIPEEILADKGAYATLEYDGKVTPKQTIYLKDMVPEDGVYVFTFPVAVMEVKEPVTLKLYDGNGKQYELVKGAAQTPLEGNSFSYAATEYLNSKIGGSNKELAKLCQALLDYGEAAQVYFGYKASGLTAADFSSVTKDMLKQYDKTLTDATVPGIRIKSANLVAEAQTTIRVKLELSGGAKIGSYKVTVDGKTVTPVKESDTVYVVEITNINAKDLDKAFKVVVSDNSGNSQTLTYSALSFAYSKLGGTDKKISDMVAAMYLYNRAAETYYA